MSLAELLAIGAISLWVWWALFRKRDDQAGR